MHTHTYIRKYIHTYTYTHTQTHTHRRTHIHTYIMWCIFVENTSKLYESHIVFMFRVIVYFFPVLLLTLSQFLC